jgi:hypothetical protein
MSSISKFCDMKVCGTVHKDRKHDNSKMCLSVDCCYKDLYSRGEWETECKSAQVVAESRTINRNVIQQFLQSSEVIVIVSMLRACYSAIFPQDCEKWHQYYEQLPAKVKNDFLFRWGMVPSYRSCELSKYSHVVHKKFPYRPWNSPSTTQDWCGVCSVSP